MKHWTKKRHGLHIHLSSQNKILLILIGALYFGMIAGSLIIRSSRHIHTVLIGYAQSITSSAPPLHILLNDFIICFLFFCSLFLLGMSVYGYLFVPIFPFIKGFSYGFSASFFYAVFGSRGILVCTLAILPQALLFSVFLIAGSYFSCIRSRAFQKREFSRFNEHDSNKRYYLTFIFLFFASFLLVLFDLFCTGSAIQLFC